MCNLTSCINTPIHPALDGWLQVSEDVETRAIELSHCTQSTHSAAIQWLNTKHRRRGPPWYSSMPSPTLSLHEWQFHACVALTPRSPRYQPKVTNITYRIYIYIYTLYIYIPYIYIYIYIYLYIGVCICYMFMVFQKCMTHFYSVPADDSLVMILL